MVLLFGMPNMGEMIFLVVIILLLFGGKKLPELARGLGAGIHEFRRGMNQGNAPVEAQEHVPERDITPHTHEREESHRPKSIPAPKARGGRPSARRTATPKRKVAKKK
jgi:sec-independent protein translocase protein TatA